MGTRLSPTHVVRCRRCCCLCCCVAVRIYLKMNKAAVSVAFCLCVSMVAAQVPFKDCGSTKGKIDSITVQGCSALPCPLTRGTEAQVSMAYTPSADIANATSVVYGFLSSGIKAPFPLKDNNFCDGTTCPAKAGAQATFKYSLPVSKLYPKVNVIVQWQVMVGDVMAFCWSLPVTIVDPSL